MIGTIAGLSNRDLFTAGLLPAFVAAPPLGVGYYGACAIGKCAPDEAVKPMLPYILALIVSLVVVAAVPWLSTGFIAH
jgi:TRAP-type C4-dicarboxylate transport system permease large subunit